MSLLSITKRIVSRGQEKKEAKEEKKAPRKAAKKSASTRNKEMAVSIGLTPILSEKSMAVQGKNMLAFRVVPAATKQQIAQAVKDAYGAKVLAVRTSQYPSKNRRRGYSEGRTNFWKKAYVKVEDITSLDLGL